jgi:activator of 2-hydroxyglutaryl-CoA dehydratase
LVGGLGKIITLTNFFQNYLKYDIFTPEFPEFTGALGAAIGKNS